MSYLNANIHPLMRMLHAVSSGSREFVDRQCQKDRTEMRAESGLRMNRPTCI